jgi:hypothetical protein
VDCKVYLPDGSTPLVTNVISVKPVQREDDKGRVVVALYNTERDQNTNPIACFYDAVGYELTGRRD